MQISKQDQSNYVQIISSDVNSILDLPDKVISQLCNTSWVIITSNGVDVCRELISKRSSIRTYLSMYARRNINFILFNSNREEWLDLIDLNMLDCNN